MTSKAAWRTCILPGNWHVSWMLPPWTWPRHALDAAFAQQPRLRGYVLDEQGALRPNVVIFIDGARCRERRVLDDALLPDSQVYILQALSGG